MQYRSIGSLDVSVGGPGGNSFGTEMFGTGADQADDPRARRVVARGQPVVAAIVAAEGAPIGE